MRCDNEMKSPQIFKVDRYSESRIHRFKRFYRGHLPTSPISMPSAMEQVSGLQFSSIPLPFCCVDNVAAGEVAAQRCIAAAFLNRPPQTHHHRFHSRLFIRQTSSMERKFHDQFLVIHRTTTHVPAALKCLQKPEFETHPIPVRFSSSH